MKIKAYKKSGLLTAAALGVFSVLGAGKAQAQETADQQTFLDIAQNCFVVRTNADMSSCINVVQGFEDGYERRYIRTLFTDPDWRMGAYDPYGVCNESAGARISLALAVDEANVNGRLQGEVNENVRRAAIDFFAKATDCADFRSKYLGMVTTYADFSNDYAAYGDVLYAIAEDLAQAADPFYGCDEITTAGALARCLKAGAELENQAIAGLNNLLNQNPDIDPAILQTQLEAASMSMPCGAAASYGGIISRDIDFSAANAERPLGQQQRGVIRAYFAATAACMNSEAAVFELYEPLKPFAASYRALAAKIGGIGQKTPRP